MKSKNINLERLSCKVEMNQINQPDLLPQNDFRRATIHRNSVKKPRDDQNVGQIKLVDQASDGDGLQISYGFEEGQSNPLDKSGEFEIENSQ